MFLPDRERALLLVVSRSHSDSGEKNSMANGIREAYRARRDCCSPVPLITTSHCVSERDSMVRRKWKRQVMEKKITAFLFALRMEGFCTPGSCAAGGAKALSGLVASLAGD